MGDRFDSRDAKPDGRNAISRPTVADAQQVLARLHGAGFAKVWSSLLSAAGLHGRETDHQAIDRLLAAMRKADPVTSLCGRSLAIRVAAHRHLTAAHTIIQTAG